MYEGYIAYCVNCPYAPVNEKIITIRVEIDERGRIETIIIRHPERRTSSTWYVDKLSSKPRGFVVLSSISSGID